MVVGVLHFFSIHVIPASVDTDHAQRVNMLNMGSRSAVPMCRLIFSKATVDVYDSIATKEWSYKRRMKEYMNRKR